jgi:glycosyltransferase involved in cell wall biosynthesis
MKPTTAIIIAHFEQPGYVLESVASAWSTGAFVVVVDDASSSVTRRELSAVCAPYRERLVLLRRPTNGGLSATRNVGIEWALRNLPDVRYILPLDADDVVESRAVNELEQRWEDAESTCLPSDSLGWLYGDATLFGTFEVMSRVPRRFTSSRLLQGNFCFSTSFIHRRVFDAGIRYDETLKRGLEDWDLYLSALEHGFVGRHAGHFGFHYRKHGVSMLTETNEDLESVEADVRIRHPGLFERESLLEREHIELPRFAILDLDRATLRCLSSPDRPHLVHSLTDGPIERDYLPPIVIAARSEWLDSVSDGRLMHQVLSAVQAALAHQSTIVLGYHVAHDGASGLDYRTVLRPPSGIAFDATRATADPAEIVSMLDGSAVVPAQFQYGPLVTRIPPSSRLRHHDIAVEGLAELMRPDVQPFSVEPDDHVYPSDREFIIHETVTKPGRLEVRASPPQVRNIGVVAPWIGLGGMDLIMLELAKAYAAEPNTAVHLLTTETGINEVAGRYHDAFATINAVAPTSHNERTVQAFAEQMDILLVANSSKLYGLLPLIRKRTRPSVFVFIQNVDIASDGASVGYLFPLARQYHRQIDGYFVPSQLTASLIRGFGVDPAKIHVVPNAAVYTPAVDEEPDLFGEGLPDRALHILYAGRFDRQKGMDRLSEIFQRLRVDDIPFEARLVGKAVLEQSQDHSFADVTIAPPSYEIDVMRGHFRWADVLVLPSRWEGLPLVMMDALIFGLLVITTDVGGIPEYVANGRECVMVSNSAGDGHVVEQFVNALEHLHRCPADFVDMRQRGLEFSRSITWSDIAHSVADDFPRRESE